ncbi:hypothetical protein FGK63_01820 [Ruegeria sediminis]|uniref:Uncharacterized protein n=1 Tax=Ruegeria sediminis TaxID=2583820 RepID=A0ABY2X384_9RHOB|nr:hypothetical protein [Ruegeria sediminis]TMV09832.1 hypothetical protein FGK63_01820 [Ruegeria sediminis]
MASPAEIANDMAAQSVFWARRDKAISKACNDAAVMIRMILADEPVDGRTWYGLHRRMLDLSMSRRYAHFGIHDNLHRALQALCALRAAGETAG